MCRYLPAVHYVKRVYIRGYSGPHFPAFGLNRDRHWVSLHIQSECGKIRTRITPNTDTFHVVIGNKCLATPKKKKKKTLQNLQNMQICRLIYFLKIKIFFFKFWKSIFRAVFEGISQILTIHRKTWKERDQSLFFISLLLDSDIYFGIIIWNIYPVTLVSAHLIIRAKYFVRL